MKTTLSRFAIKAAAFAAASAISLAAAHASPVTSEQAALAAGNWLSEAGEPMGTQIGRAGVESVETISGEGGEALFHAVRMTGGGTVVMSADTGREPVVAFGAGNADLSPRSPVRALFEADALARAAASSSGAVSGTAQRSAAASRSTAGSDTVAATANADGCAARKTPEEKWARLLASPKAGSAMANGKRTIMRSAAARDAVEAPAQIIVHPLLATSWNQGGDDLFYAGGILVPGHSRDRSPYSAFTPNNYRAGCGPVVLAQLLAYWDALSLDEKYRKAIYKVKVYDGQSVSEMDRALQFLKNPESKSNLAFECVNYLPVGCNPADYENQLNVGKLLADCGSLLSATYGPGGTSTSIEGIADALKKYFGFTNAKSEAYSTELDATIRSNLDGKSPCVFRIKAEGIGGVDTEHGVIADGYGMDDGLYCYHINFGWGGDSDMWYFPPDFPTAKIQYNVFSHVIHGASPTVPKQQTDLAQASWCVHTDKVLIRWSPFDTNATYTVERSLPGEDWESIATTNGVCEYADTTALPGKRYGYKIFKNGEVIANTFGCRHLAAPTFSPGERVGEEKVLQLFWSHEAKGIEFAIYRSAPMETNADAADIAEFATTDKKTWSDNSAAIGCWYHYRVCAIGDGGQSDLTEGIIREDGRAGNSGTGSEPGPGPDFSTNSIDVVKGEVYLEWYPTNSATGYEVWSDEGPVTNLDETVTSHTLKQNFGTRRFYAVRALIGGNFTNPGEKILVEMPAQLPELEISESGGTIKLQLDRARKGHQYRFYRRNGTDGMDVLIGTLEARTNDTAEASAVVYDTNAKTGATYSYLVEVSAPALGAGSAKRTELKTITVKEGAGTELEDEKPNGDNPGGDDNPGGNGGNPGGGTSGTTSTSVETQYVVEAINYVVSFFSNGGNAPKKKPMEPQSFTKGETAKLHKNTFTRKGFVFAGWATSQKNAKNGVIAYTDAQEVTDIGNAGEVVKLYAVWAKPKYKVAFYANGGKGKMAAQSMKYGKAAKLKANKFKRIGYTFKGWAKSKARAKKGKVDYKNKKKVKNLTVTGKAVKLYAVWKKK